MPDAQSFAPQKSIATDEQVVIYIRFRAKPGKKEEFRSALYKLVDTMKHEPTWIDTIVLEDPETPDDIILYETWAGTQTQWWDEQFKKPYRTPYEKIVEEMLVERVGTWLVPVAEWRR